MENRTIKIGYLLPDKKRKSLGFEECEEYLIGETTLILQKVNVIDKIDLDENYDMIIHKAFFIIEIFAYPSVTVLIVHGSKGDDCHSKTIFLLFMGKKVFNDLLNNYRDIIMVHPLTLIEKNRAEEVIVETA
ncbi:hypothetical protein HZS_6183 [Henneguya salminicola]|nr:hypothetical protein HZS_6183 [Henneguya salminicola]